MRHSTLYAATLAILSLTQASAGAESRRFFDKESGASFYYPPTWEALRTQVPHARVVIGDRNPAGVACILTVRAISGLSRFTDQASIDQTTAQDIEAGSRSSGSPLSVTVFKRTKVGNRPAIYYEASSAYESLGFKVDFRVVATLMKVHDQIYELSCTAPAKVMPTYMPRLFSVVGSLTVVR